jgi:hypothetical protein
LPIPVECVSRNSNREKVARLLATFDVINGVLWEKGIVKAEGGCFRHGIHLWIGILKPDVWKPLFALPCQTVSYSGGDLASAV